MVSDLLDEGATVLDRLDDLARRHGVHATGQWSTRREGAAGAAAIAEAMRKVREEPPTELAGRAVAAVTDLAAPGTGLPPTDAVVLDLEGARVVVRPSGTEPKLKCYVEVILPVSGDDLAGTRVAADVARRAVEAALPAALGLDDPT